LSFDAEKYVICEDLSIKEALRKVEKNHYGMIFVCSAVGEIIGLATDGDIRRALLKGVKLEDSVSLCANRNFVWASIHTPRENLIKKLDSHIRFIPILDDLNKLQLVISKDFIPLRGEDEIYIRSRAPVRISFGGGGSDVTHYFSKIAGAVINTAISIYSHATMKVVDDLSIYIESLDLGETLTAPTLDDALAQPGSFGLVLAILKVVRPKFGFELYLHSDCKIGSGLGGSATLCATVLGCFNILRKDQWDRHELAEIAFEAERLHLGISGGWQDQYAAVFGGFNFLEFDAKQNVVNPMRIPQETLLELEESLVLCDTGIAHHSGDIHQDQKETMRSDSVRQKVEENVALTYDIKNYLLRGHLEEFGHALHLAWQLKRTFSSMITNKKIDEIYNGALENGSLGGKLLGAGGGGFFLFYVAPFEKYNLIRYLKSNGLSVQPFRFEPDGLQSWISRVKVTNKLFKGTDH
jgi:D-glycero-alpha-D-manno-heptose-7-phosphate kinase